MPIEVNGHSWETDTVRTRRYRDVLCLRCVNCDKRTQVPMRSKNRESYLVKQEPCPKPAPIIVGPEHPAWRGLDDDDWNGATFSNWLGTLKDQSVVVLVPEGFDVGRLDRMVAALKNAAKEVQVEKSP